LIIDDTYDGEKVCKLVTYFISVAGTPSVNDYYFEIWPLDASYDFVGSAPIARSAKVDGNDSWSASEPEFTISSPVAFDFETYDHYALVIKAIDNDDAATTGGEVDADNYPRWYYDGAANGMTGCVGMAYWFSDGSLNTLTTDDAFRAVVHTMQ
jgi:hypothetical protein